MSKIKTSLLNWNIDFVLSDALSRKEPYKSMYVSNISSLVDDMCEFNVMQLLACRIACPVAQWLRRCDKLKETN
jgi:hypothetical protein